LYRCEACTNVVRSGSHRVVVKRVDGSILKEPKVCARCYDHVSDGSSFDEVADLFQPDRRKPKIDFTPKPTPQPTSRLKGSSLLNRRQTQSPSDNLRGDVVGMEPLAPADSVY
jgi:hypothetical protein